MPSAPKTVNDIEPRHTATTIRLLRRAFKHDFPVNSTIRNGTNSYTLDNNMTKARFRAITASNQYDLSVQKLSPTLNTPNLRSHLAMLMKFAYGGPRDLEVIFHTVGGQSWVLNTLTTFENIPDITNKCSHWFLTLRSNSTQIPQPMPPGGATPWSSAPRAYIFNALQNNSLSARSMGQQVSLQTEIHGILATSTQASGLSQKDRKISYSSSSKRQSANSLHPSYSKRVRSSTSPKDILRPARIQSSFPFPVTTTSDFNLKMLNSCTKGTLNERFSQLPGRQSGVFHYQNVGRISTSSTSSNASSSSGTSSSSSSGSSCSWDTSDNSHSSRKSLSTNRLAAVSPKAVSEH